jgi:glutathione S-transferase
VKLYYSQGSPFARKVRIVLAEKALDYEKDELNQLRPSKTFSQPIRIFLPTVPNPHWPNR